VTSAWEEGAVPESWQEVGAVGIERRGRQREPDFEPLGQLVTFPDAVRERLRVLDPADPPEGYPAYRAAVAARIEAGIEPTRRAPHVSDLAWVCTATLTANALQPSASVSAGGFVAGATDGPASLARLRVGSKLTRAVHSCRRREQVWLQHADGPVQVPDAATRRADGLPTYDSVAKRLADHFDEHWTRDPLADAYSYLTSTGDVVPPDLVVLAAWAVPADRLRGADHEAERAALTEAVAERVVADGVERVPPGTTPDAVRAARRRVLQRAVEAESYCHVPLVARAYPGADDGVSLSQLFRSLYALDTTDHVPEGEVEVTACIDTGPDGASWAVGTDLLDRAIGFWRARHQAVLAPFDDSYRHQLRERSAPSLAAALDDPTPARVRAAVTPRTHDLALPRRGVRTATAWRRSCSRRGGRRRAVRPGRADRAEGVARSRHPVEHLKTAPVVSHPTL
jgi:hypothetical protein